MWARLLRSELRIPCMYWHRRIVAVLVLYSLLITEILNLQCYYLQQLSG